MKKLHLILLFSWISIQLNAQTTFRVSYDIASFDISGGMVQSPAGDFVMAGTNASFLPLYGNVMKLNASGSVMWAKAYVGGLATDFWDIQNVSSGGYIMTGSSSGSGAILVRIDDNGNLVWAQRYFLPDRPGDDASNEFGYAVKETTDGGFIVGGGVDFFWDGVSGNTVDTTSAMGFKVNSSGTLQWCRVWTIATTNPDEHYINDVGESSDGYFFVGESSEGAGTPNDDGDYPRNALLIKTNTSGTLTYARRWGNGNANSEGLNSIISIPGNEMLIGGYDNSDATLFKINGTGVTPTIATSFNIRLRGGLTNTYLIQDIMRNSDGNFSCIGMDIQPLSFSFNTALFKFNSSTETQMIGKSYASIGLSAILPEGGLASDQGYYMTMTDQQATGFNYNIIRTDAAGNLNDVDPGCTPTSPSPTLSSYDPTLNVLTPTVFTLGSGASFTPTVSNISPTKGENCFNIVCTPPAAPTASASPTTICNGSSSTITSTAPAGVTYYYYTVASGGTAFASGNSTVVSPTTTTTYYVESDDNSNPGCKSSRTAVTVTVVQPPNAGNNATTTVCSNGSAINLFSLLTGSPNSGGTWSGGLTGGSLGTFTPGTNPAGTYTYTVAATAPCTGTDQSTVTVTVNTAPNAGTTTSTSLCSNSAPVNLFSLLGGSAQSGGTWSAGLTGGSLGTFTPGTSTPGTFTYTVNGTSPCAATSTAQVTVSVTTAPNAGTTTSTALCSNGSPVNLFSLLGGSAQSGGTWSAGLTGGSLGTFTPGTSTPGTFTYTVNGTGPCTGTSTAQVTVSVSTAPNAGTSNSVSFCSTGSSVNLFSLLGGSPQSGGTWSGPSALTGGSLGTFNPATNTSGNYVYSVTGTGGCSGTVTATIAVTVNTPPNAGTNGTLSICSNASAVNLFASLGGSPSSTGTWSGPSALTGGSNGTFTPGTNVAGTYTYTVAGTSPCVNAQATVVVTVNNAPSSPTVNASSNSICEGQSTSITASGTGGVLFNVYDAPSGGTLLGSTPLTVSPSNTTTYYVQANSSAGCVHSGALVSVIVTVIPIEDPSWTSPGATCTQAGSINLDALVTGTTGGTWSGTGVTGSTFDPTGLAGQTINITYSVGASPCTQTSTQSISVQSAISGAWTSPGTMCESDGIVNLNSLITGTGGGSWSGTGVSGNTFDPTGLSGTISITYSVGVNPCLDAVSHDIIVNSSPLDPTVSADNDTICAGESVTITGSGSGGGTTYNIYDSASGGTLVGTSPMTITPSGTDSYYIEATNSNGCINLGGREEIIIVVNSNPVADAGANVQLCPNDNTNLTATGGGTYLWSTTETTAIINVAPVINTTYYVTVTNAEGCTDSDSVVVTIYTGAGSLDAVLDSTTTEEALAVTTDVAANDLGNISSVSIINGPTNGTATINGTDITYTPNSGFMGYDTLTYVACDAFCTSYCDTAILIVRVSEAVVIFVPNGFSPNGDGINDVFEITGLYKYPENELFIYNRWGELVYHAKPYDNTWAGESNNDKLKLTGDEVIDGTYFYVLKLSPDAEGMNGYIELRRR